MSTREERSRDFDVVVWGATGFTGRLVAEHLLRQYGDDGDVQWAIAGRNKAKLESIRSELGSTRLPVLVADSMDRDSLDAMVQRTAVVCSTVGPFAKVGSELVAACVAAGTDYCDITGEVQWIRRMLDAHEEAAKQSGARIVNCCGFDSIPSDLGTYFTVKAMHAEGRQVAEVKFRLRKAKGTASGGTVESLLNVLEEAKHDRELRRVLANPYTLNPPDHRDGPDRRDQTGPYYDADLGRWTAPFVMAAINTRIVRRSNYLMDYAYGRDFRYSESVLTGAGLAGRVRATTMSVGLGGFVAAASVGPVRSLMQSLFLPKPGEGPDSEAREAGFYDIRFVGVDTEGQQLRAKVYGDRDPGYGSTSRMLGEAAVCLAREVGDLAGGFWTPAASLGDKLIDRLQANAGLTFTLE